MGTWEGMVGVLPDWHRPWRSWCSLPDPLMQKQPTSQQPLPGGTARSQEGGSQAEGKAAKAAGLPGAPLPLWSSQVSGGC